MGYKLKSNVEVNNSKLNKYLTEYGVATKSLNDFILNQNSKGYNLTLNQFNSLNEFENTLRGIGIWDNIIEFVPFIGNSINAMSVKYKGLNTVEMPLLGGISNSQIENNLGINIATEKQNNSFGFDLGLKNSDITGKQGIGITCFGRLHGTPLSYTSKIFGIKSASKEISNSIVLAGGTFISNYLESSNNSGGFLTSQAYNYSTRTLLNNNITISRQMYNNTEKVLDSSSNVTTIPISEDLNYYLGCINDSVNNNSNGYVGRLRLFIINDGNIPQNSMNDYIIACNKLFTDLGKNIY